MMLRLLPFYWGACLALCLVAAIAQPAFAFDDPSSRVARLNFVRGDVSFQPGGESDWVWASVNRPLTTGDGLWTDVGSRAELHIGSAAIRVGQNTAFSFLNLDDNAVQIQLNAGSLNLHVRHLYGGEIFEIDTPNVAVTLVQPGDYRIDADPNGDFTSLTVRAGDAQINGGGQAFLVDSGSQAQISGTDYLDYSIYDLPQEDEFDQWSFSRDQIGARSQSARYVSPEVTGYEDLDQHGTWQTDPQYGPVWIPSQVSQDWAPYRDGHWAWVDPWGWTWVDDAQWGFATSHYGRWTHLGNPSGGNGWAWVPPRPERYQGSDVPPRPMYSPANVAFLGNRNNSNAFGNGGGVAWFPLAPGEVYVPAYQTSTNYVTQLNVTNTVVQKAYITNIVNNQAQTVRYANQSVPGGVVAVPQAAFVSAQPVAQAAVKVSPNVVSAAQVVHAAPVAPVKASVLGATVVKTAASAPPPKPPAAVVARPVVAKVTPPPPRVPFAQKQQALAANAGKPLDQKTEQNLRNAAPPPAPVVKAVPATTPVKAAATLPKKPQPANPAANQRPNLQAVPSSQQTAKQQADKARADQLAQQEAEKARADQAAKQRADKARADQLAQQAVEKARTEQAGRQQADKAHADQLAQQAEKGKQPSPPLSANAPAGQPLHVAEKVQAGKLVFQPKLNYPANAKAAHLQGVVRLQALIGTDGKVKNVTMLNGPPELEAAAMENARQRQYQPTLVNGKPVEVETEISVDFQ